MLSATLATALLLGGASAQSCGRLWKEISFDGDNRVDSLVPYVEELAYQDWAPYAYLDGFYGDDSTKGTNNKRAILKRTQTATGSNDLALEVTFPEGCVTSACAMQVKTRLPVDIDEGTLQFEMKFGPDFDWVRGGKLPGFCGADCLTGCKEVSGLNGWSSRQMWRPCVWPPEADLNTPNCSGGKIAAYVYHMFKEHWCGDDFEFSDDRWAATYTTPKGDEVDVNYFQPKPEEWYTIYNYVKMNTAGPPDEPVRYRKDGVLQTWLDAPDFEAPILVVDKQDLAWRQFTNVSIDTLYFSTFFGGSSPSFQAKKDETIQFNNFKIWEGKCPPGGDYANKVSGVIPKWPELRSDLDKPTVLKARMLFEKAFVGGGCGDLIVENTASVPCTDYSVEVNVRPDWGQIMDRGDSLNVNGLSLVEYDAESGWYKMAPQSDRMILDGNTSNDRSSICFRNNLSAKYLPDNLNGHITVVAHCTAGPASQLPGAVHNPVKDLEDINNGPGYTSGGGSNPSPPTSVPVDPPVTPSPPTSVPVDPPVTPSPPPVDPPSPPPAAPLPSWCTGVDSEGIYSIMGALRDVYCEANGGVVPPGVGGPDAFVCECGYTPIFPDNKCVVDESVDLESCKDPSPPPPSPSPPPPSPPPPSPPPPSPSPPPPASPPPSPTPAPDTGAGSSGESCVYANIDVGLDVTETLRDVMSAEDCASAAASRGLTFGVYRPSPKNICLLKDMADPSQDGRIRDRDGYVTVVPASDTLCGRLAEYAGVSGQGSDPDATEDDVADEEEAFTNGECTFADVDFSLKNAVTYTGVADAEDCLQRLRSDGRANVGVFLASQNKCWAKNVVNEATDGTVKLREGYVTVVAGAGAVCGRIAEFVAGGDVVDSSIPLESADFSDGCSIPDTDFMFPNAKTFTRVASAAVCRGIVASSAGQYNVAVYHAVYQKCWAKAVADPATQGRPGVRTGFTTVVAGADVVCSRLAKAKADGRLSPAEGAAMVGGARLF